MQKVTHICSGDASYRNCHQNVIQQQPLVAEKESENHIYATNSFHDVSAKVDMSTNFIQSIPFFYLMVKKILLSTLCSKPPPKTRLMGTHVYICLISMG